jgi:peptide/nickel transport system substrate-binding protein
MRPSPERSRFLITAIVAAVFTAVLIVAPLVLPFDPNATALSLAYRAPGEDGFILGSDSVGRDVLMRVIFGGSESVVMAFAIVGIAFVLGTAIGLAAGLAGGVVDEALDKFITMFQAFPSFVLAIAIAAILGQGMVNMVIAVVAVKWTEFARLARSLALSLKTSNCVKAARVCGANFAAIGRKYLLPNMTAPLIVMAALSVGDAVLTMAGLSFLGLGPGRPTNEWGAMMNEAASSFQFAPWCILVPGCALFIAVTIFNLLGDTLRDALDVKSHAVDDATDRQGSENDSGEMESEKKGRDMKRMKWKRNGFATMAVALACAAVLALAGCGGNSASSSSAASSDSGAAASGEKVLNAGSTAYFYAESMDPANSWDGWEMQYYGITENLLKLTDDFDVEPWLAESVEDTDDHTWVFKLRDNVTFSNGEKMTGDAVKACLERTYKENSRATETLAIDSIEADGQTVTIKTKEVVPSFKNIMCDPIFSIYYVGEGIDYAADTPCTGPYKMSEFIFEDHTTLVPNENYWNGTPKLDKIVLNTFFDSESQILAMQNGEVDILAMPGASAYTTLVDNGDFKKHSQTSTRADFIRFNMAHPVVAEQAVRTAISYCIDRENYADVINVGTEVPSYGVYSSQLPYGGTDGLNVTVDKFSTDEAAKVLDEAGIVDSDNDGVRELADGTPVEITLYNCSTYERFVRLADDLQSKLASVGIKLNITSVDYWLQDSETYNKDNPDMTIDSYGMAPTGDASYFASMCFTTDGSQNFGKYSNKDVDALVKQLQASFDENERTDLTKQISQKVLDDSAYIFFGNSQTSYIARDGVTGFALAPSEYYFITVDTDIA